MLAQDEIPEEIKALREIVLGKSEPYVQTITTTGKFFKGYRPRWKWFCIHKWACVSLFATRKCTKCGKEDVACPW